MRSANRQMRSAVRGGLVHRSTLLNTMRKSSTAASNSFTPGKIAGIAFFSTICFTAIGLGVWQTKRYNWKIGVIEANKKKVNDAAEPVPSLSQSDLVAYTSNTRGKRVTLTGTFDHGKEILVGPRSSPPGLMGAVAQGLAINPQVYFHHCDTNSTQTWQEILNVDFYSPITMVASRKEHCVVFEVHI